MDKVKFTEVEKNGWFEFENIIFSKASEWKRGCFGKTAIIYNDTGYGNDGQFSPEVEVNLDWWEAIAGNEDAPKWLIIKAFEDGAKIEYTDKDEGDSLWQIATSPDWDWWECSYRVKSTTHTINIDGKEIELSEESYNNLKKSLK